jgi:hypothetical protein
VVFETVVPISNQACADEDYQMQGKMQVTNIKIKINIIRLYPAAAWNK